MQLRLRRPRPNRAQRNQIRQELRANRIKHLARNRHALTSKIAKQLPTHPQPLIDLIRLVDIGVINQTLPADRSAWLLEVGAHDDEQVIFQLIRQ